MFVHLYLLLSQATLLICLFNPSVSVTNSASSSSFSLPREELSKYTQTSPVTDKNGTRMCGGTSVCIKQSCGAMNIAALCISLTNPPFILSIALVSSKSGCVLIGAPSSTDGLSPW
mmetsp:Transcript_11400/g.14424  ORF Transcript_11400/g.14424 Transcript_11400/m.14424 type:complete len:116 (-) Transcript_11400:213-560(-)